MATRSAPVGGGRVRGLFAVDVALLVALVLVIEVPLTGLVWHEWLGIALAIGCGIHLVQHAAWAATALRRLVSRIPMRTRIEHLLVLGVFVGFVSIVASGLLISEHALSVIGVHPVTGDFWRWLHLSSVVWVIWLTGIHLAWHTDWIVRTTRRFVIAPLRGRIVGSRP